MTDIWSYLQNTDKPIVMYGMGNGADKILSRLEARKIEVKDFFASDDFVRGHFFHGKKVLTFTEIKENYDNFIILLSFGSSLDSVLDKIYSLDENYELYAPDVPVTGDGTFDAKFYTENLEKIEKTRELLSDSLSVRVYDNIIKYKLTGKICYLKEIESSTDDVWSDLLSSQKYKICIDAGAYNGDTAREIAQRCNNMKTTYCLEPDAKNYKKLLSYAENDTRIIPLNCAAWNENKTIDFGIDGNRNSNLFNVSKKSTKINARKIDDICNKHIDYIKYDVEGAEKYAIEGSSETIKNYSPDMLVSLYHRNEDIFSIPLQIHKMNPEYKLYMRKFKYIPAWDLNLYAIKK